MILNWLHNQNTWKSFKLQALLMNAVNTLNTDKSLINVVNIAILATRYQYCFNLKNLYSIEK